jgi:hypothetical protein
MDRMAKFITSPDIFAQVFNARVPGAYRRITTNDIRDMVECGLIGRHNYHYESDLETVRGVLQYEQLREQRLNQKISTNDKSGPPKCRMCGQPLPIEPESKGGRPKEYCPDCNSLRGGIRQKKVRQRHRNQFDKVNA